MNKGKLWITVLAGLMIGQLFAESERPFKVVNTVRTGYNDNTHYSEDGEGSFFVTDVIDLSFRAALSDRTDLIVKSQLNLLTESGDNQMYPNLYFMLNHNVSPRLLLRLSEYYRSGDKSGSGAGGAKEERYNYFYNKITGSADYVLTRKDRLQGSLSHEILVHDQEIDTLDYTIISEGVSWKRDLVPQRTYTTLNLNQRRVTYDNQPEDTATRTYLDDKAFFDATDLSAGINHTFNQEWQGSVEAGVTYVQPNFSDAMDLDIAPFPGRDEAANDPTLNPLFKAGLVYSPSPRTRLTGDISQSYQASDDEGYGGQNSTELRLGAQHDITAKLMAKATVRLASVVYDAQDNTTGDPTDETEERMEFELRFTYKLNRMNFLELGLRHSEIDKSNADGWKQNVVDVGWRIELN